jgi:predicted nucleic acid-binding protein
MRNRADWLVADERLLRRVARAKGISVVGALGILLQAVRAGNLSRIDARQDVEAAIARHGLCISVALYQRVIQEPGQD